MYKRQGLVIAPILGGHSVEKGNVDYITVDPNNQVNQQISINIDIDKNDESTLKVVSSKIENGVASESTQVFKGSQKEMMSKLEDLKIEGKILKVVN